MAYNIKKSDVAPSASDFDDSTCAYMHKIYDGGVACEVANDERVRVSKAVN